ncbi:MAG: phosphoribosylamine--glycine ligase, partial [Sphingopyxis sp.]|nr:phosphoribosylamine--glycine ligase [Sphingopyxis sp.]
RAAGIPTAAYGRFATKEAALAGLADYTPPYVIKADGLAAGKGVIIAEDMPQARAAIDDMFGGGFGDAGAAVVIEDFMVGEEVSFFALSDGQHVVPFGSAQDHKRVGDGDTGPNTGGMGAYSPTGAFTPAIEDEVMARIIRPTVAALADAGMPYQGVLFAGLMLTAEGPKLIEYNCRFGDPECQVLMARFSGDLAALLHAVATGTLGTVPAPVLDEGSAVTIVVAARGYPGQPATGGAIRGLDAASGNGLHVFQAGTRINADGQLVAAGGRVLAVTATALTVGAARDHAYHAVNAIQFDDALYRRDIGWREMARSQPE